MCVRPPQLPASPQARRRAVLRMMTWLRSVNARTLNSHQQHKNNSATKGKAMALPEGSAPALESAFHALTAGLLALALQPLQGGQSSVAASTPPAVCLHYQ